MRGLAPLAAALIVLLATASVAGAGSGGTADSIPAAAPADSGDALGDYLDTLADSTDQAYGAVGAPIDTAGLDTALVAALARLEPPRRPGAFALGAAPWFQFDRVDGATWGAAGSVGTRDLLGRLTGRLGRAAGPDAWQGGAEYALRRGRRSPVVWALSAAAGRWTESLDPDLRRSPLSTMKALVSGSDLLDYLRRDGVRVGIERESPTLRLGAGWRDQLESPLATTTTWNLTRSRIERAENRPATPRRIRELEIGGTWRVPRVPVWLESEGRFSLPELGSGADYRRWRVSAAGELPVARWAGVVTQATYGRLTGELLPQNALWLGGRRTLRSVDRGSLAASGRVFGRLEVVGAPNLLGWAPPELSLVPAQLAVFVAAGGTFGRDPFTGVALAGTSWPALHDWKSEAGVSLLSRPGLPDPRLFYRFDFAHPLGPGRNEWRIGFGVSTSWDLVRPIER